jgi:Sec-independent protein translocase protein TatA
VNLISPVHLLFIAAFALVFIGPRRLPELARALGAGLRVFRDVLNGELHPGARAGADSREADGDPGVAPAGPFG